MNDGSDGAEQQSTPAAEHPEAEGDLVAYRFGLVLALLFVTFVFLASGPTGDWVPLVAVVLQGATLLAAFSAAEVSPRLWRTALAVVVIGLVSALTIWTSSFDGAGVLFILNALLVVAAPVVIADALVRRRVIDIRTVMGALCIYVLLGMLWAFTFGAIAEIQSEPFFAEQAKGNVSDFLYFSFVTLTTTGYGDLTAEGGLGRTVAVLEALLGQLYLVTIVAVIVSRMARTERRPPRRAKQ